MFVSSEAAKNVLLVAGICAMCEAYLINRRLILTTCFFKLGITDLVAVSNGFPREAHLRYRSFIRADNMIDWPPVQL